MAAGTYTVIRNATPSDARVRDAGYDRNAAALYIDVESDSYDGDEGTADPPVVKALYGVTFSHGEDVVIERLP